MIARILIFLILTILSVLVHAREVVFEMSQDRVFVGDFLQVEEPKGTIVLLPGINRALEEKSETSYFDAIKSLNYNVLSIATSAHPRSIAALGRFQTPQFRKRNFTISDFADEIEFAVAELGLIQPTVVSLSYSSTILDALDPSLFDTLIEMVPMADPLEGESEATFQAREYQEMLKLNPFGGPQIVRYQRDSAYRLSWQKTVSTRVHDYPKIYGSQPRLSDITEGYVSLARASEDYRLINVVTSKPRYFILAAKEASYRFDLQVESVRKVTAQGPSSTQILVVDGAGHILPSDQPKLGALAIDMIRSGKTSRSPKSGYISESGYVEFNQEDRKKFGL